MEIHKNYFAKFHLSPKTGNEEAMAQKGTKRHKIRRTKNSFMQLNFIRRSAKCGIFFYVSIFVSIKKTDICQGCTMEDRRTCIERTLIEEFQILNFCRKRRQQAIDTCPKKTGCVLSCQINLSQDGSTQPTLQRGCGISLRIYCHDNKKLVCIIIVFILSK